MPLSISAGTQSGARVDVDGWPVQVPDRRHGPAPVQEAPTFSVCIATYQAADTVAAAVDSALVQTLPPLEVVVVDDGSTDGTAQVLAHYAEESRVRVLVQDNAGEARAKNAAVQAARGEFIVLLDADDVYLPDRLRALAALATARPDLDLLTTDAWIVHDGERVGRVYHPGWPFEVADQRRALLVRNPVFGHLAVRRTVWLDHGGFSDEVPRAADWDLWQRMVLAGSGVGLVDVPLSHYVVATSTMSADRVTMHEARARLLRRTLRRDDLSRDERALVRAELRVQQRGLALGRLRRAALDGEPNLRRQAVTAALRAPGLGARGRAVATATALAPRLVRQRVLAQEDGTVAVAGGVRVPRR